MLSEFLYNNKVFLSHTSDVRSARTKEADLSKPKVHSLLPGAAAVFGFCSYQKFNWYLPSWTKNWGEKSPSAVHCLDNTCGKTQTTCFGVTLKQAFWPVARMFLRCFSAGRHRKNSQQCAEELRVSWMPSLLKGRIKFFWMLFSNIQAYSGIQKNLIKICLSATATVFCILYKCGKTCNGVAAAWMPNEKSCSQTWQSSWGQP